MNEETNTHLTDEAHIPIYTSHKEEYETITMNTPTKDTHNEITTVAKSSTREYLEPILERQIWDAINNKDMRLLSALLYEPQFPKYQEHIVRHAVDSEGKKIDPMEYVGER